MHLFIKQRTERRKEITKRAYKNLTLLSRSVITRDLILMHLYVVPAARNTWPPPSHLVQQEIQTQDEVKVEKLQASIEKGYARSSRSEIGHAMDWRVSLEKIRG